MTDVSNHRRLNPKKLLLSKWTAVHPQDREKHFLVTRVENPETKAHLIERVELEAVLTRRCFNIPWAELADSKQWLQGWH
ncbi:MAG: TIGR02450 family Trp-rich protein [Verrucomicrobiota bacterium]